MVQDVEKFRSKLDVEALRDFGNVIVLENGEIQVEQSRTNQPVATRVAEKVCAIHLSARRRGGSPRKRSTLRRQGGRGSRRREAAHVDVLRGGSIVRSDSIASRN